MPSIGFYFDEIYTKDGVLIEKTPKKNIFVYSASHFFNYVIKEFYQSGNRQPFPVSNPRSSPRSLPLAEPVLGQIYHAFGQGDSGWDISPVDPNWYDEQLVSEFYRRIPDSVNYIKYGVGTAQSGSQTEIIDPRRTVSGELVGRTEVDDWFNGQDITIVAGTNIGETRTISDYDRITGTITVSSNFTNPIDDTSEYEIIPIGIAEPSNWLEIRTTLPNGNPGDPFNDKDYREHGLFGGEGADATNGGIMITVARHAKKYKDHTMAYIRYYRIGHIY